MEQSEDAASPPPSLGLELTHPAASLLRAAGEIDSYSGDRFREGVSQVVADGAPVVHVDLADVTYLDSAGLGVLAGAHNRLAQEGRRLVIMNPRDAVYRVFEMTGLTRILEIDRYLGPG